MIANQVKGRGFGGTLAYVLGKDGAERIGGNMLGENAQELTAEFSESRKLKPNVSRAVYHTSLSLPAGERLSQRQVERGGRSLSRGDGVSGLAVPGREAYGHPA